MLLMLIMRGLITDCGCCRGSSTSSNSAPGATSSSVQMSFVSFFTVLSFVDVATTSSTAFTYLLPDQTTLATTVNKQCHEHQTSPCTLHWCSPDGVASLSSSPCTLHWRSPGGVTSLSSSPCTLHWHSPGGVASLSRLCWASDVNFSPKFNSKHENDFHCTLNFF